MGMSTHHYKILGKFQETLRKLGLCSKLEMGLVKYGALEQYVPEDNK